MPISLDATYSLGRELSGVGVYSREILYGLASAHALERFHWAYRTHRIVRSLRDDLPPNAFRRILRDGASFQGVFHGLNQRLPSGALRKAVTTFHDLFVLTGDYSTPEFRARFAAQARDAARRSGRLIAVSEFTANQAAELLGVERGRIRVIPHGVRLPPASSEPREKIVLHVGAIQTRKNIERLAQAFGAVDKSWRLVLAGSNGFGADRILAAIGSLPWSGRIEIRGYVTAEELRRLYRIATILAFPSLDEGFGIPVLEAMANAIAVLTSNRSALPETAGDAALLVNPMETDEIAHELRRLTEDEDLRAALIEKGIVRAAQMSWRNAVDATWNVYLEDF